MNNTDKLNLSLGLVKQASPAWAKLFNQLSEASRTRIVSRVPPNMVRSVGKKPLDDGAEGMVFPSVTGGRGESAVKVFYDRMSGKTITPNETINPNFKQNIDKRIELLSSYPSIFPEIHASHPRGWAMERLQHVRNREPINWQTPLNQLRTSKYLLKYYRNKRELGLTAQTNKTLFERIRSFLKPNPSNATQHYDKLISDAESRVKDIWQNRHAPIPYHPMSDLARRVSKVAPHKQDHRDILTSPLKGVTLPLKSGPVRISDFGATVNSNYPIVAPSGSTRPGLEYHNIMQRANGQPVISDPLVKQAVRIFGGRNIPATMQQIKQIYKTMRGVAPGGRAVRSSNPSSFGEQGLSVTRAKNVPGRGPVIDENALLSGSTSVPNYAITSGLHEGGHGLFHKAMAGSPFSHPRMRLRRGTPDQHPLRGASNILNEYGANNSAAQVLRQAGIAAPDIQNFLKFRQRGFDSHLRNARSHILAEPVGLTPEQHQVTKNLFNQALGWNRSPATPNYSFTKDMPEILDLYKTFKQ